MIKKIEKIILITFTMLFLAIICSQIVKAGTVNKGDVFMTFKRAMLPENNDNEKGYYCLNDNRSFKTYNATGQWMSTGFEKLDKKTVKLDLNEAGYVIINDREKSTKDTELAHMVWFFKEHGKEASHKNTDGFPGTDSQKYLWKKAESWLKEDGLHYGLKVTGGANVSFDTTEMDNEAEKWINKLVKQAKIKKTEGSEEPKIEYKKAKGLYIIGPFNYTFGKDNLKAGDNLEEGETLDAEYKDIEVKGAKNWYLSTENGNEKETVESGKNFYIAAKKLTTSEVQVKINVKIKTYKATIQVYKSTGYIKDSDGKIKPYRDGNGDLIKHQNMIKGNVEKDSDVITKKITVTSGKYHAYIGVRKNDEYGNSLAGATFTVYKGKSKNGTALGTITTASNTDKYGSNGDRFVEITIDDLDDLPLNYYIYETKVPSGYKSNGRGQVVTLTKDDVDTIIVPIDKKPSDRIIKTFTNYKYEGPTITQDENTIKIYKTEKTDSGEEIPLSGVTFELRVKNGLTTTGTDGTETTSDWVQEVTTEDNGIASYKFSTEDTFLKAFDTEYTVEVSEKEFNNNDLSDDLFGYERDDTVYEIKVKKTKKCKNIKTTIDEKTGETKEDHSLCYHSYQEGENGYPYTSEQCSAKKSSIEQELKNEGYTDQQIADMNIQVSSAVTNGYTGGHYSYQISYESHNYEQNLYIDGVENSSKILTFKNKRNLGNLVIKKVDENGNVIEVDGIKFKVTLNEDYTFDGKTEKRHIGKGLSEEVTTNGVSVILSTEDGVATLENIWAGKYTVEEIVTPWEASKGDKKAYTYAAFGEDVTVSVEAEETDSAEQTECDFINNPNGPGSNPDTITIEKRDLDSGEIVQEAGFGFKIKRTNGTFIGNLVCEDQGNGRYKALYEDSEIEETIFYTGNDGKIVISGLMSKEQTKDSNGNISTTYERYIVEEVKIPNDGLSGKSYGYVDIKDAKYSDGTKTTNNNIEVTLSSNVTVTVKNKKRLGDLHIIKRDNETKVIPLENAKFKLQGSKGWIRINDLSSMTGTGNTATSIEYTSKDFATELITDSKGEIFINDILEDSYTLCEIQAPKYYEIAPDTSITVVNKKEKGTTETTVYENRVTIDLSGYVWIDRNTGKVNIYNNLYDEPESGTVAGEGDEKIDGIPVYLYKDGQLDRTAITTKNGYKFAEIDYPDLEKYHIEFEYNGVLYTSVEVQKYSNEEYTSLITPDSKAYEIGRINEAEGIEEKRKDYVSQHTRESINNKFTTTTYENTNNIQYDSNNQNDKNNKQYLKSEVNYMENAKIQYNDAEKGVVTEPVKEYYGAEKYRIISTTKGVYTLSRARIENYEKQTKKVENYTNVNQGMRRRDKPDMSIKTDLLNSKVDINGNTSIFEYNKSQMDPNNENPDEDGMVLTVDTDYYKYLYKEDLEWNTSENKGNGQRFDIYLTYGVKISNTSESNYWNLSMLLNNLDIYYDTEMLELQQWGTSLDKNTKQISNGNVINGNGEQGTRLQLSNVSINPNKAKTIYLQFKVTDEGIKAIKDNENGKKVQIVTEVSSYTTYISNITDYTGKEFSEYAQTKSTAYAGIDKDSAPGNVDLQKARNDKLYEDDTSTAPTLTLKKRSNSRSISGIVFEDKPENIEENPSVVDEQNNTKTNAGKIRQGNGKFDSSENKIQGVTVRMIDVNSWNEEKQKYTNVYEIPATGNDGEYTIESFVPGQYIIQYIWGENGKTIDGNEIGKTGYNIGNYKNTIYSLDKYVDNDGNKGKYSLYKPDNRWYVSGDYGYDEQNKTHYIGTEGYSVATDLYSCESDESQIATHNIAMGYCEEHNIYNCRKHIDEYLSTLDNSKDLSEFSDNIIASTSQQYLYLPVEIDSDIIEQETGNDTNELVITSGDTSNKEKDYTIKDINFGIIERARQSVELIKKVSNVKVTLANGTDLINTNVDGYKGLPGTAGVLEGQRSGVKYIRKLGAKSGDNGTIDMEIDKELLYGATLEITYKYTFKNNSELDYNDNNHNYYRYGTTYLGGYYKSSFDNVKDDDGCRKDTITITPTTIIDYVDNELSVNDLKDGYSKTNIDTLLGTENNQLKVYASKKSEIEEYEKFKEHVSKYNTILRLSTIQNNSSNSFEANIYPTKETTSTITLNRLLTSNTEEAFTYNNDAEIVGLTKNGGNMVGVSQYSKDDLRHQDYRIGNYDPNSEQYGETDKTYREETDEIDSDGQTDHTETVIITPPTGEDRSYTYYIIGAVALMVLATGIIVIKKLVLK